MALQKELEINNTGVTGEYIKVNLVKLDTNTKEIMIDMQIYASQEAREAGKNPISNATVRKPISELDFNLLELIYNDVKTLPEFEGALDV